MLQETSINSLFNLSRDERQELCKKLWINARGCGCIEATTGFGKTKIAINIIKSLLSKKSNLQIIVVVPTTTLKQQWLSILDRNGVHNVQVLILNTAASHNYICDFLIIDEIHRAASLTLYKVFETIKYKLILGLTATMERLDERHKIIEKYCPIVDRVTLEEARANGWVSDFTEYQVLISVDDIDVYQKYHKEFIQHWEFFGFSDIVMSLIGKDGIKNRWAYVDAICHDKSKRQQVFKEVTMHTIGYMRCLQKRKNFIYNHPKKLEIARKIINARADKKIITFSNNVKMAEGIGIGYIYTGKQSKNENRITIEEFEKQENGVLNSCVLATEGFDCKGLSTAIILGINSSRTKAVQSAGRVIRKEGSKFAEIFNIIIENTNEVKWFETSHANSQYVTIDEDGLDKVLNGEEPEPYIKKPKNFIYRF